MTPSEAALAARYGGPAIPLADVCQTHFGLDYKAARERATAHRLPVPTFRLTDSQKAPLMLHLADLARYIDETHEQARREWEKAQA
ncbi:MAG: pyocin activator PrtN family protein [Pseudomonadota bacterium]